jgi:hypothetical protein
MATAIAVPFVGRSTVRDVYGCGRCHGSGVEVRYDRGGLRLRMCDCPHSRDTARQTRAKAAALAEADQSAAPVDLVTLARLRDGLIAHVGAACYARWISYWGRT